MYVATKKWVQMSFAVWTFIRNWPLPPSPLHDEKYVINLKGRFPTVVKGAK